MQFSDKLDFLMRITNTTNKELSQAICVDRSLISLLRTGKRKQPKNREYIRKMSSFLAQRADADFERHAIAEIVGQPSIRSNMPSEVLAEHLHNWLIGEEGFIEHLMNGRMWRPKRARRASSPCPARLSGKRTSISATREGVRQCWKCHRSCSVRKSPAKSALLLTATWTGCLRIMIFPSSCRGI